MLREVTQDDMEAVYRCFSSDDVTRYYGQDSLTDREQLARLSLFSTKVTWTSAVFVGEYNGKSSQN
ncbi:hypothetical protein JCM10914_1405 [Paenibacillus sp. JCM 10914]|nr:hypothetical protein JCM10914_1405 [Paenibacillus sp. JCM 10914]